MTDQPRPQGQLDVQRWLGRCMLRLQQYERLMKTLLAHHELAGPADTLEAQRAANLEKVSDKTLGTLVKSLFESYAVPDGFERELLPEDKVPTDRISMAISYRMTMAPERLAEVRAQIEELVVMRNELVHHFIERFDLWSDPGCEAAWRHLEHCYTSHTQVTRGAQGCGSRGCRSLVARNTVQRNAKARRGTKPPTRPFLEQLGRFALFCALSALRGLA